MGFIQRLNKRTEANKRMAQELKDFQRLTSKSNYKETLLCQIKHSSTKREKKLLARFATDILEWLVTYHRSEGGTMASKVNGLIEKHLKYKSMTKSKLKQLMKSRTFWSAKLKGIVGIMTTVIMALDGELTWLEAMPAIITTIWSTADIIIRMDTTKKIK